MKPRASERAEACAARVSGCPNAGREAKAPCRVAVVADRLRLLAGHVAAGATTWLVTCRRAVTVARRLPPLHCTAQQQALAMYGAGTGAGGGGLVSSCAGRATGARRGTVAALCGGSVDSLA